MNLFNKIKPHLLCFTVALFSLACLILFSITLITEISRASLASRVADQVLRFHIIANSDSQEDQMLKLQVRDALIAYMSRYNGSFDSADEAAAFAAVHCTELQQVAEAVIQKAGYTYTAKAGVTFCNFPDKTYGDLTFPAGRYRALRVEIGQARGQNWWCVLYPLLCFTEEGIVTVPEESQNILQENLSKDDYQRLHLQTCRRSVDPTSSRSVQVRFWLRDWISSLFVSP